MFNSILSHIVKRVKIKLSNCLFGSVNLSVVHVKVYRQLDSVGVIILIYIFSIYLLNSRYWEYHDER